MYDFRHLPDFAAYLLKHHLREVVEEQLQLSRELKVPLLRFFQHLSDEELISLSMTTFGEFLEFLAENKARQHLSISLDKWATNQLPLVQQLDLVAEDVTLIGFVRSQVLKNWAVKYKADIKEYQALTNEIDIYYLGLTTSATNTYIDILKQKIEDESHLSTQLINASPGIVFLFDLEKNRLVFVNNKVEQVLGYSPREMEEWDLEKMYSMIHPDDAERFIAHVAAVAEDTSHLTRIVEYRFKSRSDLYIWLRTYGVTFKRDQADTPVQLLGQCFDISVEKEISLSLKKREEQLLAAQELAMMGSFDWNLESGSSELTPELKKIFGEEADAMDNFLTRVHPADRDRVTKEIQRSFTTGYYDCEYRYLSSEGEKILWGKGVVAYKDGKPVSMQGTVQDITSRKKAEQELKQKTVDLQRSNENLQQFASIASHDLNEPLRKIATFTDLVIAKEGEHLTERSKGYLKKVMDSSKRMRGMIDDILAFSAVNKPREFESYSMQNILEEAIDNLEYQVKQTNAKISSDGLPTATIIPFQMRQLFQNLLSNSMKFTAAGEVPVIRITHHYANDIDEPDAGIRPADKYLIVEFKDNGIGFEQQYADKIFGLFNRLHGKQAYEGTGIGLAICRKAAENHGGSIRATSQPGKGATFTLYLPQ